MISLQSALQGFVHCTHLAHMSVTRNTLYICLQGMEAGQASPQVPFRSPQEQARAAFTTRDRECGQHTLGHGSECHQRVVWLQVAWLVVLYSARTCVSFLPVTPPTLKLLMPILSGTDHEKIDSNIDRPRDWA